MGPGLLRGRCPPAVCRRAPSAIRVGCRRQSTTMRFSGVSKAKRPRCCSISGGREGWISNVAPRPRHSPSQVRTASATFEATPASQRRSDGSGILLSAWAASRRMPDMPPSGCRIDQYGFGPPVAASSPVQGGGRSGPKRGASGRHGRLSVWERQGAAWLSLSVMCRGSATSCGSRRVGSQVGSLRQARSVGCQSFLPGFSPAFADAQKARSGARRQQGEEITRITSPQRLPTAASGPIRG